MCMYIYTYSYVMKEVGGRFVEGRREAGKRIGKNVSICIKKQLSFPGTYTTNHCIPMP